MYRWLGAAAAGLTVSTVLAESILALLAFLGAGDHLLWALTRPTAAATSGPAWLAVIWLGAATAGSALASAIAGHDSAAIPCGTLPAASLALVAWYFRQPGLVTVVLVLGPMLGCLLGMSLGRAVRRRDQRDGLTASPPGAGI
ncbi:MAG: hypothetical protein ACLFSC_10725 [Wenzhouxiangella sp.]